MMLLRLAWRNIWRNKRRSLIIITSIVVGVVAMSFVEGLSRGFLKQMFENQLGAYTSHLQIHHRGFNDNKIVQNFIAGSGPVTTALEQNPNVRYLSKRVIAFGILSSASNSAGVSIVGISPTDEANITTIDESVLEGRYLSGQKHEIVISKRLAETLGAGLGDRVVAMASTLDGKVGSEVFRIVGLYQSASSAFDRMHIYVPLQNAQEMLRVGERIAEVAVVARSIDSVGAIKADLMKRLDASYEVLSYQDLLPSLLMQMEMAGQLMWVFYLIIGLAMIFGIINTMLMSVFERIHEFGVLKAVGMKNGILVRMILLEAFLLGSVGALIGGGGGILINLQLSSSGINFAAFSEGLATYGAGAVIYPVISYPSIATGMAVILLICILAAMYPAYRAVRLEPINAIRYV
ncbi:MAG: FtsX-like permease family protein [Bacteroidota bacterium]